MEDESKHPLAEHNERLATELTNLMHRFGNLFIHVSGEAKVDFKGACSGWAGMFKSIISGDIGCISPYEGYDTCALQQALDTLYNLEICPHMNMSSNEQYVVDAEDWLLFVKGIEDHFNDLDPFNYKSKYEWELKGGDDKKTVIARIVIQPLCNEFVVGEFNASQRHDFLGEIEDYDQPKINTCWVVVNGDTIDIELNRLIHFRHKQFHPRKGDYLLYDPENDCYVILPQEDYSIH